MLLLVSGIQYSIFGKHSNLSKFISISGASVACMASYTARNAGNKLPYLFLNRRLTRLHPFKCPF